MDQNVEERKIAGQFGAFVAFVATYGLLIARYDLWGLALGWLPAALAAIIAGYIFYRVWWFGYIIALVLSLR
jgi:hypothetical protein